MELKKPFSYALVIVYLALFASACLGRTVVGPPIITSLPPPHAIAGEKYSFTLTATGGLGQLTWSGIILPANFSLNSQTGELSGIPDTGTYRFRVRVTDWRGRYDARSFRITVGSSSDSIINLTTTGFQPSRVKVKAGTRVTWQNKTRATHTLIISAGSRSEPISAELAPEERFTHPFTSGQYTYTLVDPPAVSPEVVVVFVGRLIVQGVGELILSPIGDQTVSLGNTLNLTLVADSPREQSLTYSATPMPLPATMSLNAVTGKFTFRPDESQILGDRGSFTVTFRASDGFDKVEERVKITVSGRVNGGDPTVLTGRVLDTTDFVQARRRTPVVGSRVSLLSRTSHEVLATARSGKDGYFKLSIPPFIFPGNSILDIDTTKTDPAPDGSPYASFRERIRLITNIVNVVDRPFFLPRIDEDSLTTVDPGTTTVVNNPTLGITITIPPNTAKNADGTNFKGQLSISEVPKGLAPASLPPELQPGLLITIQPVGVTFNTPVPITFPNTDDLAPDSETDIWSLDPETGCAFHKLNRLLNNWNPSQAASRV